MTNYIFVLIMGLLLITFSEALARFIVQSQNNAWHYKFGEREVGGAKLAYLITGFCLAIAPLMFDLTLGCIGILAAFGAWKLSTSKPVADVQKQIKVRPSSLPPMGNSPIYVVLIAVALAVFASMIIGAIFWGWYS